MPSFRSEAIADLAHQLTLSPKRLRPSQIQGIEAVLEKAKLEQSYPFEWVCYLITGYQKRSADPSSAIPGETLVSDLVLLAEFLSRKARLSLDSLSEEVLSQEEVAERLRVSTKTLRRWRRRGLLGIRVVYQDEVSRLVFPKKGVDRFVEQNGDLVRKASNFSQLSVEEKNFIIARARELVTEQRMRLHETAKQIAAEMGRAVETVRYTIRRHDAENKAEALFVEGGRPVLTAKQQSLWRAYQDGEPIERLARVFEMDVPKIQRMLNEAQVLLWQQSPPECVYNAAFDAPGAAEMILQGPDFVDGGVSRTESPDLPSYLKALYLVPLLSAEQEADLFRRYNFLKHQATKKIERIEACEAADQDVTEVCGLFRRFENIRERIVRANLRLVVSVAKKHVGFSGDFFEVVSDGNMSLMRAVEKFDYARGFRFSTYATWAIMKNYARSIPEQRYHQARMATGQDEMLAAAPDTHNGLQLVSDREDVRQQIRQGLEQLTSRERAVVMGHFGLGSDQGENLTLEEIGRRFGVTKERVRQIEKRAIAKLRGLLSPALADQVA